MLPSGNDSAVCLAENFFNKENSYGYFVSLMNKVAKYLTMNNTQYENPHGL